MNAHIDAIQSEIKRRILTMVVDNPNLAGIQLQLETAALIGASVVLETPLDLDDNPPPLESTPQGEELLRQLFEGDDLECCPNWGKPTLH